MHYRQIYEQHYGYIPLDAEGRTFDIHHKDGNRKNNEPENLVALSIEDHYNVHYEQGDWGACLRIISRKDVSPELLSELATKANLKRSNEGTNPFSKPGFQKNVQLRLIMEKKHHFQNSEWQRNIRKKEVENGTSNLLGPEMNRRNLKNGKHCSQIKKECPHCNKTIDIANYARWHGDRCKAERKRSMLHGCS